MNFTPITKTSLNWSLSKILFQEIFYDKWQLNTTVSGSEKKSSPYVSSKPQHSSGLTPSLLAAVINASGLGLCSL